MQKSTASVVPISLGVANVFAIRGRQGWILVDTGDVTQSERFLKSLELHGIAMRDIVLVVITHVHYDHVGNAALIRKKSISTTIAVHEKEVSFLQAGRLLFPAGTGAFGRLLIGMSGFASRTFPDFFRYEPVNADIIIKEETSLVPFGIDGSIVLTPGHTIGSLSVLLDDGTVFVGDLAVNFFPWGGPVFPPFADDVPKLMESWRNLMDRGIRLIYPGHGKSFPVSRLQEVYEVRRKKLCLP
jgi:glyoxylase-like metal-dependent hydrolase (beta-lactamase superfamily II)